MNFGRRVCLKPSNDRGDFELDRAKSKNNIAENSFALEHETDNCKNCLQMTASALLLAQRDFKISVIGH